MKHLRYYLLILIATCLFAADSTKIEFNHLVPEVQHRKVAPLIVKYLTNFHYQKRTVDDSLSAETFDSYFDNLDPSRVYLLQSDIDQFKKYRYQFDDMLNSGHIEPAYDIFHYYEQRIAERLTYAYSLMETPLDLTTDEYLELDRTEAPWASGVEELDDLWRKRLKNEVLNLKLSGKNWEETVEILTKRYQRVQRNYAQLQSEDIFQILINSFSGTFDPHTSYFSPKDFDNFKIQMSQAYSGIGARLLTEDEYTVVKEIIPGGPADKSDLLHENDKIVGVGQENEGEIVDVVGWRIDDVVQLIRGEKETIVHLELLKAGSLPGAPSDTIALMRDKIKLEDRSAEGRIIQITQGGRDFSFGVIDIPSFYSDFDGRNAGEENYKSTTHDVEKILTDLNADTLDGIIIDLRRNGGGFLNEAITLTGLFIEKGPVVQVRNTTGKVGVEWDDDPKLLYSGPLTVVVDRISASASEIFAAAIQDYKRGIIIGSQTFGKGTVQNAVGLNRFFPNTKQELGQMKITIAKFYRINGGSTQHVGVIPDITFPSRFDLMDIGESSEKNALLWDQIQAVDYPYYYNMNDVLPQLITRHTLRLNEDPQYTELKKSLEEFEINKNKTQISLNLDKRQKEREEAEQKKKDQQDKDEDEEDLILIESARVLSDFILLADA